MLAASHGGHETDPKSSPHHHWAETSTGDYAYRIDKVPVTYDDDAAVLETFLEDKHMSFGKEVIGALVAVVAPLARGSNSPSSRPTHLTGEVGATLR